MSLYRLKNTKERRAHRAGAKVRGTKRRPRLSVFRSNRYLYAQLIDDVAGETLGTVDSETVDCHKGKTKTEAASSLGEKIAELAKEKGITQVVFDKGPYKYHGRVKSFAEAARKGGLQF